tara:strand:- start:1734 stop:2243 length:510 start_codon:yes stop_codon:yes gene_type:complete
MNKVKIYLATLFLISLAGASHAQNPIAIGQSQANFGVGLSSWGIPLYVGLDHGVHENVTIGGELSYRSFNDRYRNFRYNHSIFGVSGNANFHFNALLDIPKEWNFYAGLNLGFYHWSSPSDYGGNYNSGLGLGAQIGGRYYFKENLGVNLELGGGSVFSGGKFGLSFKL